MAETISRILIVVYRIITVIIRGYTFLWFIWIILSWLRAFGALRIDPFNPIMRILSGLTDGVVNKVFGNFRRRLVIGIIDLSPFIFLLILTYVFPPVLAWLFNMLIRLINGY